MATLGAWEKSKVHQTAKKVSELETAAESGLHYGATANDLANFPGMMNLVAGSNVTFTPGAGTLTINATGGGGGSSTVQLTFGWDGAGTALVAGQTVRGTAMTAMTITDATVLSDLAGNCTIDIWKDTYANYPPDIADSIVGGSPPALVASDKSVDSALTGWTTSVAAGDTFLCTLSTVSGGITQISVTLGGVKV
ncbi:MAG TPA: hypothetical protein P5038_21060 [Candidatus Paceibacterota bacterium]|nr:hypothetical protein [Candidatus Paceibacterota bacterium]